MEKYKDIDINDIKQIEKLINEAITKYSGTIDALETAIGAFFIGKTMGWKPLYLMHSRRSILLYEKILDIRFKDIFAERGVLSHKSVALNIVDKIGGFWDGVNGILNNQEFKKGKRVVLNT